MYPVRSHLVNVVCFHSIAELNLLSSAQLKEKKSTFNRGTYMLDPLSIFLGFGLNLPQQWRPMVNCYKSASGLLSQEPKILFSPLDIFHAPKITNTWENQI